MFNDYVRISTGLEQSVFGYRTFAVIVPSLLLLTIFFENDLLSFC